MSITTSYQTNRGETPQSTVYYVPSTKSDWKGNIISLSNIAGSIYHRQYYLDNSYGVHLENVFYEEVTGQQSAWLFSYMYFKGSVYYISQNPNTKTFEVDSFEIFKNEVFFDWQANLPDS